VRTFSPGDASPVVTGLCFAFLSTQIGSVTDRQPLKLLWTRGSKTIFTEEGTASSKKSRKKAEEGLRAEVGYQIESDADW
jgi:hypothetical protein